MKSGEIKVGGVYWCKVSGTIVPVKVMNTHGKGYTRYDAVGRYAGRVSSGFTCQNLKTGRRFQTRSAARLRRELTQEELARIGEEA
jgi:hypothetical protein